MTAEEGKLLLISSDFPPISGGQSRYLYDLWSCLPGEEVVLLVPEEAGAEEIDGALDCRVVRLPLPLGEGRLSKVVKAFRLLWAAWKICRSQPIRAIHCGQMFSGGFAGYACRRLLGIRYYLYAYGADLLEFRNRFPWGPILKRFLQRASRIVAISNFTRSALLECGVREERIELVYPAIDLDRFAGEVEAEQVRREWGWEGKAVILSVARLVERKGQDTIILALARVAERVPQVHYAIGGSGPYRERLEALAVEEGVEERVEFLGFVDEEALAELYAGADLFSMVSREILEVGEVEGFGIVYLEANAAGRPVLAGRSGGVEDAVVDGETGLLVDPEDVDEVVEALVRLLRDEELRSRLGTQGRERVHRDFDRRRQAVRLWEACR